MALPRQNTTKRSCPADQIVKNWLRAVDEFRTVYQQLNQRAQSGRQFSQCHSYQLAQLCQVMRQELIRLTQDVSSVSPLKQLRQHTGRLTRLNNQAQASLWLAVTPAC